MAVSRKCTAPRQSRLLIQGSSGHRGGNQDYGLDHYVDTNKLSSFIMFPGVFYALLAGFLAAVASSSAKLSLGTDYLKGVCETGLRTWGEQRKFRQADETTACDRLHIPLRLLCGGLLFTCNAVMWTFLAKALRYSSSSTRTTVTTTASNFVSSAFLGQLIFGEAQITLWWVGISLTFSGLLVLQRVSPQDRQQNVIKDE
uniref:transmembrane protein 42 n=1 Tax=Doryrhamphus excisus TaxID=161450 RepID=UPI0025AE29E0|nr:transmembrane protein 42 [Doryrhamphus excisus]XP_057902687.1 transmembrane protein 42 [Doryrhamphus excisus]